MAGPWMDFALIRERAEFATILARYDIAPARVQGQISVLCPFHDDRQPSLSVNLENNENAGAIIHRWNGQIVWLLAGVILRHW